MEYQLKKFFSSYLNREMSYGVYGNRGKILMAFASQDGKNNNFADFGMVEVLKPWIDSGMLMVVTPDSVDEESYSDKNGDVGHRMMVQENFYHFIVDELYPCVQKDYNNFDTMWTTGCSMGGFHALNFELRRPDLFDTCIALSGCYDMTYFLPNTGDMNFYNNSPVHYMGGMSKDHPYIEKYNENTIIVCSGKGNYEEDLLPGNYALNNTFQRLGIQAWFDYWGEDVAHDWPWWRKQIVYFMNMVMPL